MQPFMDCHGNAPDGKQLFAAQQFYFCSVCADVFLFRSNGKSPQPNANGDIVGAENCLWLNIYTPQMPDETTGLPVIVFIHGGGYRIGSANQYTV